MIVVHGLYFLSVTSLTVVAVLKSSENLLIMNPRKAPRSPLHCPLSLLLFLVNPSSLMKRYTVLVDNRKLRVLLKNATTPLAVVHLVDNKNDFNKFLFVSKSLLTNSSRFRFTPKRFHLHRVERLMFRNYTSF